MSEGSPVLADVEARQSTPSGKAIKTTRDLSSHLAVALAYLCLNRLGHYMASQQGGLSLIWPAIGFGIGAILLGGYRYVWAIFLAEIVSDVQLGQVPLEVACTTFVNLSEVVVFVWLARLMQNRLGKISAFATPLAILIASLLAPAVGASFGIYLLYHAGIFAHQTDQQTWLTWWTSDSLSCLLIVPVILSTENAWSRSDWTLRTAGRWALLITSTLVTGFLIFTSLDTFSWIFLFIPVLVLASEWFDDIGPGVVALLIAAMAIGCTLTGRGPFLLGQSGSEQVQFDLFLFCLVLTSGAIRVFRMIGSTLLPSGIMGLGWFLAGLMLSSLQVEHARAIQANLDKLVTAVSRDIEHRLDIYIDALRGVRGLYQATPDFNRAIWLKYVENFDLHNRYPGINGFGIVFPIVAGNEEEYLGKLAQAGITDLKIHSMPQAKPPSPGDQRFIITYLAPLETNRPAYGLDLASEITRRVGAEAARDSGEPRISDRMILVQDSRQRAGFLLFVPMYRPGMPVRTMEQRRAAHLGWTYAPFITENLLAGVLQGTSDRINLQVFHGATTTPESLVYSTRPAGAGHDRLKFQRISRLKLAGQDFTLGWDYLDQQSTGLDFLAICASFSPAIGALLLAGLVLNFQSIGERAQGIAEQRTKDLQTVNSRLQAQILENARAEAATRRAMEAAEAASKAKSEFLATMSHEIRTPMNSVLGFAELLQNTKLTSQQSEWLGTLRNSGESLLGIINDILDFSSIEAGRLRLGREEFDPIRTCSEAVSMLDAQAKAKGLTLHLETSSAPPGSVLGDPVRFRQVLTNLIGNAIKFTATGSVTVHMEWQEQIGLHGRLHVSVIDTGPGIAPSKQSNLFQMFTQVDTSDTRKHGGTGLGLAISKRLVELMRGTIGMSSKVGHGSTFWFELPMELAGAAAISGSSASRVLVMEPPGAEKSPLIAMLQKHNCIITPVAGPTHLLARAASGNFEAIFLVAGQDLQELCGIAEKIRQQEAAGKHSRIPVIGLAGNPPPEMLMSCLAAGMDSCMSLPLRREDLASILRSIHPAES